MLQYAAESDKMNQQAPCFIEKIRRIALAFFVELVPAGVTKIQTPATVAGVFAPTVSPALFT